VFIGLLALIAVPSFIKARANAQKRVCIANLRAIDSAKHMWATENRKADTAVATAANLGPYFNKKTMPTCPAAGTYNIRAISKFPTCNRGTSAGHKI
jgi:hypothetical protein